MAAEPWIHVGGKLINFFGHPEGRQYDEAYRHEETRKVLVVRCAAFISKKIPKRLEDPKDLLRLPGVYGVFAQLVSEGDGTVSMVGPDAVPGD